MATDAYLVEIVGHSWLSRTRSGAVMLHLTLRGRAHQDVTLFCGGKEGKPTWVPDVIRDLGHEGTLAALHRSTALAGLAVRIAPAKAAGFYNVWTPWGKIGLSDAQVEAMEESAATGDVDTDLPDVDLGDLDLDDPGEVGTLPDGYGYAPDGFALDDDDINRF